MTYVEFLDSLRAGITLFVDALGTVTNALLGNYIFMTILGITIFSSCFIWFVDWILNLLHSSHNDSFNFTPDEEQFHSKVAYYSSLDNGHRAFYGSSNTSNAFLNSSYTNPYNQQLYDNYSRDVKRGYKGSYTEYKKQFDKLARSDFSDLSTDNSEDEDSYSVTNTDYMF